MKRYVNQQILSDLSEFKMVLLAGPRQVGKTTVAQSLYKNTDYMNWDIDEDRTRILNKEYKSSSLLAFDEIHKYTRWRNYLKGIYDKVGKQQKILVTGSAKLDVLRKGGDSLQGRYYFMRLMPLSFAELKMTSLKDAHGLYTLSGFPEPFLRSSKTGANRWSRLYRQKIVREEVSSNEQFQNLGTIEIMYNRLPELVASPLSLNSLSEDVQVSHKTLSNWLNALERLYALFRISPFGTSKIKAIKKMQKAYFFDWNAILDEGQRYENFLAVHILKWIYFEQDTKGRDLELCYYRDKYNREVDFVITERSRPIHFIEAKLSDAPISKSLQYMKSIYPDVRTSVFHLHGKKDYRSPEGIEHMPVHKYLSELV